MINGGAIIPPPIERFPIKVMRQAKQHLDPVAEADLLEAMVVFNKQEGQHLKVHTDYLEMLRANGYPCIREYEAAFEAELEEFLATRGLAWNLGYGEGFESSGPALAVGWMDGTVGEFARGHYGDRASRAAVCLFEVDRASMAEEEVAASVEREMGAWLAIGEIEGEGFAWIHDCDCNYDPTDVPAPQRYEQILAAYS